MSVRIERARAVLLGAVMCVGCTAPLILAEEPGIDGPLVPTPAADAGADASGDPPVISEIDGGQKDAGDEDGAFAEPNNATDAAGTKPDAGVKDASGD